MTTTSSLPFEFKPMVLNVKDPPNNAGEKQLNPLDQKGDFNMKVVGQVCSCCAIIAPVRTVRNDFRSLASTAVGHAIADRLQLQPFMAVIPRKKLPDLSTTRNLLVGALAAVIRWHRSRQWCRGVKSPYGCHVPRLYPQ